METAIGQLWNLDLRPLPHEECAENSSHAHAQQDSHLQVETLHKVSSHKVLSIRGKIPDGRRRSKNALQCLWGHNITEDISDSAVAHGGRDGEDCSSTQESERLSQTRMSKDEAIQDLPKLITTVGTVLDLLGHKNPRLRVLNLTDNNDDLDLDYLWCNILDQETYFSRCRDWTSRSLAVEGRLDGSEKSDEDGFDVVICVVRSSNAS